jgi:MFS transporter, MHS family, shikimate and dehydroshikimate transport protein
MLSTSPEVSTSNARRTAIASLIGTSIEWYDFYIYGTASALVFGQLFFPSYGAVVGTMLAFATFALGAIMRPLGGLVCGHYGDRVGRKSMLVLTLMGMGVVTFAIGLLPTYSQVGVAAPLLLIAMRMIQGFAFGGEWGGAVLMSVEHAPANRRGFYGSFPQMGSPIGLFLSTAAFGVLALLPREDFLSWGWRIPFLLSAILVIVGLVLRLQLLESPEFQRLLDGNTIANRPVVEAFSQELKTILIGAGAVSATPVAFYIQTLFVVSYATQALGIPRQTALNAVLIGSAAQLMLLPLFALLSDYIGRKPVAMLGIAIMIANAFPFFALVKLGNFGGMTAAVCLALVGMSAHYAVVPAFVSELFSPRLRYTGISASYTIAAGLLGGLSPAIGSGLYAWAQDTWPVALFLIVVGVISLVSIALGRPKPADALYEKINNDKSRSYA